MVARESPILPRVASRQTSHRLPATGGEKIDIAHRPGQTGSEMVKMPVLSKCVLANGGALALACCRPLGGADPLDSGELSVAVTEVVPSSVDWDQERRLQDDRVQRLSGESDYGTTTRGSAGVDVSSDF